MNHNYPGRPYPTTAFYNTTRNALFEVQDKVQAPAALIGSSALTAMSIASQALIDVELPTGQRRPCALYLTTIAESGERKTTTDNLLCAPIFDHDADCKKAHDKAMAAYALPMRTWEAVNAAIERKFLKSTTAGEDASELREALIAHAKTKPIKPTRDRIIFESTTERPLMEALRGDSASLAIVSEEGETVLKGGVMANLGMLNKAWDGAKSITLDRADDSIEVTNPRLTVSFMVQSGVFHAFLDRRGAVVRASGHLARYLACEPQSTQGFRFITLQQSEWECLPVFHARVKELLICASTRRAAGDRSRTLLTFSPEAKEAWVCTYNVIEGELRPGGRYEGVRDFSSKFMDILSRVAAILHYFDRQAGSIISVETFNRARDLASWYGDEFIRLFCEPIQVPQYIRDVNAIWHYLLQVLPRTGGGPIPRNDVRKSGPVRHQGRFEAALDELVRRRWIRILWKGRKQYVEIVTPPQCGPAWSLPSSQTQPPQALSIWQSNGPVAGV